MQNSREHQDPGLGRVIRLLILYLVFEESLYFCMQHLILISCRSFYTAIVSFHSRDIALRKRSAESVAFNGQIVIHVFALRVMFRKKCRIFCVYIFCLLDSYTYIITVVLWFCKI